MGQSVREKPHAGPTHTVTAVKGLKIASPQADTHTHLRLLTRRLN